MDIVFCQMIFSAAWNGSVIFIFGFVNTVYDTDWYSMSPNVVFVPSIFISALYCPALIDSFYIF